MTSRLRCTSCGNLTRFDVVRRTRTSAFHHYSTGGHLEVEDVVVLEDEVESITCRWCGPVGRVQEFEGEVPDDVALDDVALDDVAGGTVVGGTVADA